MPKLKFAVDAALLEELGERLVGRPSTALAELIKNSYDADATIVKLLMNTSGEGRIEVRDNGHGMTFQEFRNYWMRIGSQHKRLRKISRHFKRPFTGSKGVGRIAAQLLSSRIVIESVSETDLHNKLVAQLDWREAISSPQGDPSPKDLIDVEVEYEMVRLKNEGTPGTGIILSELCQRWSKPEVEDLARQIWKLQPPFRQPVSPSEASPEDFQVIFEGGPKRLVKAFHEQMGAILMLWTTRVVGKNDRGKVTMSLEFRGGRPKQWSYTIPNHKLESGEFELRFFELQYRQPRGILVSDAREYMREFGGVHIYDAGFSLPFYGEKDNDWLFISHDAARRLSLSDLLPDELQIKEGMQWLPQWYQVLGVVNVSTGEEPNLEITITRDRLVESAAFEQLQKMVRGGIHWYAMERARRHRARTEVVGVVPRPSLAVMNVTQLLDKYQNDIPKELDTKLRESIDVSLADSRRLESQTARQVALLSSLATAGISSIAYQHELNQQLKKIDRLSTRLESIAVPSEEMGDELMGLRDELVAWTKQARSLARIFAHIKDSENIDELRRYRAKAVVDDVEGQIDFLLRGAEIETDGLNPNLRLPTASYAEWVSVFQNAFFNALNAMQDSPRRFIDVRSSQDDEVIRVMIQDTGIGVDLEKSEKLFEPFERRVEISPERRDLGLGGTGLGLTIVRMICERRGCRVYFGKPSKGFATALILDWSESE